ncbi:MAG TPA: hypothetical protein VKJ65_00035, partial [Phycisphaerae bacterium]|nr:hypothetical protein [Phycisphaerae bacterium]
LDFRPRRLIRGRARLKNQTVKTRRINPTTPSSRRTTTKVPQVSERALLASSVETTVVIR